MCVFIVTGIVFILYLVVIRVEFCYSTGFKTIALTNLKYYKGFCLLIERVFQGPT